MSEIPNKEQPRFLVDGMLGSLARKLRILGFDTVYDPKSEDDELRTSAWQMDGSCLRATMNCSNPPKDLTLARF